MYSYIINDTKAESHFSKSNDLTDLKSQLQQENHLDCIKHAYRIDDLTKAINTSVLLDPDQRNIYNMWLTDGDIGQFDASDEFVDICKDVGECDIS